MTPFDINPEHDAGHSIDQDDLIAFHLRELQPPQDRAIHRAMKNNAYLQAESIAIASTLRAFPKQEPSLPLDAAALDRHWQALRNSLPPHVPAATIAPRSFFTRWGFPALAASALAATAIILALYHSPRTTTPAIATNQSPSSANAAPPASNPNPTSDFSTSTSYSTLAPSSNTKRLHNVDPTALNPSANQPLTPFPTAVTSVPSTQPSSDAPNSIHPSPETSPAPAITASNEHPSPLPIPSPQTPSTMQLSRVRPPRLHNPHSADITLAVLGNLTVGNSSTSGTAAYTQSTTPAIGVLASFHQQLRPWLGYRITATHSEPTFRYAYQVPTAYSSAPVTSTAGNTVYEHAYELAGTYVVQGPHRRRISTSAEAGAGLLAFLPPGTNIGNPPLINAYRPEAVAGVSAELALTRHISLHAGYRALLYKAPASYYGSSYGVAVPSDPGNLTLSSEPVLGLTYRFHEASE
jgi:hypothetical protein